MTRRPRRFWRFTGRPLPAHGSLSQVVLALLMAVPFGFFFRWLDQVARRINTFLMHQVDRLPDERLAWDLWVGILGGIGWSWVRYTFAYACSSGWAGWSGSGWPIRRA